MEKLFYSIVLLLSLGACCTEVPFENGDRFWFENYSINDSIVFYSNQGDFDTMIITGVHITNANEKKCNSLVSAHLRSYARIECQIAKDTFGIEQNYLVQFTKDPDNVKSLPILRIFNMEFRDHDGSIIETDCKSKLLSDCFIFDHRNCGMNYGKGFKIVEFIWNKKLGLISYRNSKGERWTYSHTINKVD